jgi:hypothetical protein
VVGIRLLGTRELGQLNAYDFVLIVAERHDPWRRPPRGSAGVLRHAASARHAVRRLAEPAAVMGAMGGRRAYDFGGRGSPHTGAVSSFTQSASKPRRCRSRPRS